jgi:AGCS family alanine or glycine:cation symporter
VKNLSLFPRKTLPAIFILSLLLGVSPAVRAQDEGGIPAAEEPTALTSAMNIVFGDYVNPFLEKFLFFSVTGDRIKNAKVTRDGLPVIDPATGQQEIESIGIPFIVFVLFGGALFFSFWYRFITVRGFKHSLLVIAGKYDNPSDAGEISHFRALTSALSATIGLGNIAMVAIAIQMGGPGAVFWMWLAAFFGMASKFSSCTLSQLYRRENRDGTISGGPMYYLDLGFKAKGRAWAPFGKALAVMYAFMVMGGAIGGGNMFQSNQAFEAVNDTFGWKKEYNWVFGVAMSVLVGLVVIGGIKRIGAATSRIVPFMCGLYVITALYIIAVNASKIPDTFGLIFRMAFTDNAFFGGMFGVIVMGVKRAAFSNEAGLGSAAIAHAAAKTKEPVREGIVAMIGPFVDTIIVCTMTALVVIITGTWSDDAIVAQGGNIGAAITNAAFSSELPWFKYILTACIFFFAYSTMISWCYYGERGWIYLLDHFGGAGLKTLLGFRVVFVLFVFIGAVTNLGPVLLFADLMILCMALPNILGSIILAPHVLKVVREYWGRYTSGQMPRTR